MCTELFAIVQVVAVTATNEPVAGLTIRVALDDARAIANDLGISTPAWNAALEERAPTLPATVASSPP